MPVPSLLLAPSPWQALASPSTCCSWRRPPRWWAAAACASTHTARRERRERGCSCMPPACPVKSCCGSTRKRGGRAAQACNTLPICAALPPIPTPARRSPRVRFAADEAVPPAAADAALADQAAAAGTAGGEGGSAFEAAAAVPPERGVLSAASAGGDSLSSRRRRLMYSKSGAAGWHLFLFLKWNSSSAGPAAGVGVTISTCGSLGRLPPHPPVLAAPLIRQACWSAQPTLRLPGARSEGAGMLHCSGGMAGARQAMCRAPLGQPCMLHLPSGSPSPARFLLNHLRAPSTNWRQVLVQLRPVPHCLWLHVRAPHGAKQPRCVGAVLLPARQQQPACPPACHHAGCPLLSPTPPLPPCPLAGCACWARAGTPPPLATHPSEAQQRHRAFGCGCGRHTPSCALEPHVGQLQRQAAHSELHTVEAAAAAAALLTLHACLQRCYAF